jgi:hypothetical protein
MIQVVIGITIITFILEVFNPIYNSNLKQGVSFTSGAILLSTL